MTPLLSRLSDNATHRIADLYDVLADDLGLSDADRNELLPSGASATFKSRVGWARTYLKKAGLLEQPARAVLRITPEGSRVLREHSAPLDVAFLRTIPKFVAWHDMGRNSGSDADQPKPIDPIEALESPEDTLGRVYKELRAELADELLERIKASPPSFFEKLVVDLMLKMGYGGSREEAGKTLGKSHDGGIDGIIDEDRLGLDVIYLQAKRWENTVGRPVVQAFVGSLAGVRANKGVLITTSSFTLEARNYVQQIGAKVVLIDGEMLTGLMIQYGLAVATSATYEIKRIDSDYFDE